MTKEVRVSVRVTPELKARLHKAEEITGLPETQVVIRSLEAYCDYVEANGEFTSPFVVVPKSSLRPPHAQLDSDTVDISKYPLVIPDEEHAAAEDQAPYGKGKDKTG